MLEQVNEYILACMTMYEISATFSYSSIALASLLLYLEKLNFKNFLTGIINLIIENGIPFDMDAVW